MIPESEKSDRQRRRAALLEANGDGTFLREITTGSMMPTLRPGDLVRFARSSDQPEPGEIWAFEATRQRGQHLAHRVLWRRADGRVLTKGDNLLRTDGWIEPERFFGPALERCRDGLWHSLIGKRQRAMGLFAAAVGSLRLALGKIGARRNRRPRQP